MAKKDMLMETVEMPQEEPIEAPVVHVAPPAPKVTFDAWFAASDRSCAKLNKPHHKVGMRAWTNTNVRRTKAEWDQVFKTY
jgi:hypothetical protein